MRALLTVLIGVTVLGAQQAQALVYPVGDSAGLIEAIRLANAEPDTDIISLEKGLYVLQEQHGADAALPEITSTIIIRGNGAEIRRYASTDFRLLHIARDGVLRLENLVLAEGSRGAIRNYGELDLRRVSIMDNTTLAGAAIVDNFGKAQVIDCDISFNTIASAKRDAGIIVNYGQIEVRDTRFTGNRLTRSYDSLALASSMLNYGEATLDSVLISENDGEPMSEGAPQAPLVNLGNGRLELRRVQEQNNLPSAGLVARVLSP